MPDLNIKISKDAASASSPENPANVGESELKPTEEQGKPSFTESAVGAAIVQTGKQLVLNGVSQFGNLTGNYQIERTISNATRALGDAVTVAKFGPAGAIYVGASYATDAINSFIELRNRNLDEEFRRQRVGMISTKGSRY